MKSTQALRLTITFGVVAVLCPPLSTAQLPDEDRQRQRRQSAERENRGPRFGPGSEFGRRGRQRGLPGGSNIGMTLLRIADIQEELNINDAQTATIEAAIEAFREERREALPNRETFRNLSDEERAVVRDQWRLAREQFAAGADDVIVALLDSDQNARLKELVLQVKMKVDPIGTLKSDEIRKSLKLTDDQVAKCDAALETMQQEQSVLRQTIRESFSSRNDQRPDFAQIRQEMQKLDQKFSDQALGVLTEDQVSQLQTMQGTELKVDLRSLLRNRRNRSGFGSRRGGRGQRRGEAGNQRRSRPPLDLDEVSL